MAKIITIEGTDGSGKATQSRLLQFKLKECGYKVKLISFPNYENKVSSYYVTKYLNGEICETDPMVIANFYALDRALTLKDVNFCEYDYVIFDRYTQSNMIYQGSLKILNEPFLLFKNHKDADKLLITNADSITDNTKKIQILESMVSHFEAYGVDDPQVNTNAFNKAFVLSNDVADMERRLHIPQIDLCVYLKLSPEIAQKNRISRGRTTDIIERDMIRMKLTDIYGRYLSKYNSINNSSEKWVVIDCDDGETMLSPEKINEKILAEV